MHFKLCWNDSSAAFPALPIWEKGAMRLEVSIICMAISNRGEPGAIRLLQTYIMLYSYPFSTVILQSKNALQMTSFSAKHIFNCMFTGYRLLIAALALQSLYASLQACSHLKRASLHAFMIETTLNSWASWYGFVLFVSTQYYSKSLHNLVQLTFTLHLLFWGRFGCHKQLILNNRLARRTFSIIRSSLATSLASQTLSCTISVGRNAIIVTPITAARA